MTAGPLMSASLAVFSSPVWLGAVSAFLIAAVAFRQFNRYLKAFLADPAGSLLRAATGVTTTWAMAFMIYHRGKALLDTTTSVMSWSLTPSEAAPTTVAFMAGVLLTLSLGLLKRLMAGWVSGLFSSCWIGSPNAMQHLISS